MAIINVERDVKTNIVTAKSFVVTDNAAKLFSMLSSMLYKDKERSCLTELSSNALDAHKLVNKEHEPIHITMPTQLCPEVRVRDFGPGLSEENVYKFLTTYGESSKSDSNAFIGGFGIGSKSPAAVTDSWTIHSHYEGVHKQYLIYVGSDGIPSLTKIFEKLSDTSGLDVIIPVQKERINAWFEAAKKTYRTYKVIPVIHNLSAKLEEVTYTIDSPSFTASSNYDINRMGASALVNGRLYPLDLGQIKTIKSELTSLKRLGLIFKFDIGEVELNLSREDLQYTSKTIDALSTKIEKSYKELDILFKEEVKDAQEENDYFVKASTTLSNWFGDCHDRSELQYLYMALGKDLKFYSKNFSYGNKSISFILPNPLKFKGKAAGSEKLQTKLSSGFYNYVEKYSYSTKLTTCELSLTLSSLGNIVFVEDDASCINLRVKHVYKNSIKNVLIAKSFSFLPSFLQSQVKKASSLEKPPTTRAQKQAKIQSALYTVEQNHFEQKEESYFTDGLGITPVAYVKFTSAKSVSSIEPEYDQYYNILKENNILIVGIKVGKKVTGDIPLWAKHPKAVLKKLLKDKIKDIDVISKDLFIHETKYSFGYNRYTYSDRAVSNSLKLSKDCVWNDVIEIISGGVVNKESTTRLKIENIKKIAKSLSTPVPTIDKYNNLKIKFKETYPMIDLLMTSHVDLTNKVVSDTILSYVKLINK